MIISIDIENIFDKMQHLFMKTHSTNWEEKGTFPT
jgi:hypothetical protein